ncbi:hypothetical protein EIP86_005096 [Pleurotus ostreatoroseus]|nr:hypothetical protein EIP86_005096 [Pleurotus ostreatoroseus]
MDGQGDPTRALLEQLLAAQGALLKEVRESKEQITVLSTRLGLLEAYKQSKSADSAAQQPGPGRATAPGSAVPRSALAPGPPERRSVSTSPSTLCGGEAASGSGFGLNTDAEASSGPMRKGVKRAADGPTSPRKRLRLMRAIQESEDDQEYRPETPIPSEPELEPEPPVAPKVEKKRKGKEVVSPVPSGSGENQTWESDDVVIISKEKPAKPKTKRKINVKPSTPVIVIPDRLDSERPSPRVSPNTNRRLSGEPNNDLLPSLPSQEDIEASSSTLPTVHATTSKFSIRGLVQGEPSTEAPRKSSRLAEKAAARKKPRLAVEVCIRMSDAVRQSLASARSFEEVVKSLEDDQEPVHQSDDFVPDYHDVFEGDLSDLTDSDDDDMIPPVTGAGPPPAPPQQPPEQVDLQAEARNVAPDIGAQVFDAEGLRRRLFGHTEYEVDLSDHIRNILVTREFMSATYGGSAYAFYPKIGPERRAVLGHNHHFLFPNLMHNPHAPQRPGQPGLLCRSGNEAPWGDSPMKVLVRIRENMWWYMGEYQTVKTEPLSRAEFARLDDKTKRTWAATIRKRRKRHDVEIRARIALRRRLEREPTEEDLRNALATKSKFEEISEDDIVQAFEEGHERIYAWCFKCVGYDDAFQEELAEKIVHFVSQSGS